MVKFLTLKNDDIIEISSLLILKKIIFTLIDQKVLGNALLKKQRLWPCRTFV